MKSSNNKLYSAHFVSVSRKWVICPKCSLSLSAVFSHPHFQLHHQPLIISLLCAISFQNICNFMAGWFTREVSNRSGAWKWMNGFGSNGSPCETVEKWKRDQNGFTTLNKSAVKKRLILDPMKVCSLHCFHSFVTCVRRCFYYYFFISQRQGESSSCRLCSGPRSPQHPSDTHHFRSLHIKPLSAKVLR